MSWKQAVFTIRFKLLWYKKFIKHETRYVSDLMQNPNLLIDLKF